MIGASVEGQEGRGEEDRVGIVVKDMRGEVDGIQSTGETERGRATDRRGGIMRETTETGTGGASTALRGIMVTEVILDTIGPTLVTSIITPSHQMWETLARRRAVLPFLSLPQVTGGSRERLAQLLRLRLLPKACLLGQVEGGSQESSRWLT